MVEIMSDLKSSEVKGFEEYFDKLKEHAVKALKEKKGIQHHFDMAKMYGQKAFFWKKLARLQSHDYQCCCCKLSGKNL